MINLNHNLSAGDLVLLDNQLLGRNATFQFTQTGITGSTAKIEVYIKNHLSMPWILLDDATLAIISGKASDYIRIVQPGYEFVRFKLVTGGVTNGKIVAVYLSR